MRPKNWREIVAEYGWGTAPARLMANTRANGECIEWLGATVGDVPQIRIAAGPAGKRYVWTESAQRLAWTIARGTTIPPGLQIKRTCCNLLCLRHLRAMRGGGPASVCSYRRLRDVLHQLGRARGKLSKRNVATIRRWKAEGKVLAPLAARYGVSLCTIYFVARRFTYADSWLERDRALDRAYPRRKEVGGG